MISSAAAPILPAFPPGFPAVLAMLFAIAPRFPDNVLLLKAVSIASMAGVAVASYRLLTRAGQVSREIALLIAVATAVTPAFVFLATSTVMAECLYTLLQCAALILLERAVGAAPGDGARSTIGAGALAAAATLVRSAGAAIVVTGTVYLLWRRSWRRAAAFALVAAACLAPWLWYASANAPTDRERSEHGGSIAFTYTALMRARVGGAPAVGYATAADVAGRVAANLLGIAEGDVGAIVLPALFRGSNESGEEVFALGGVGGGRAGSMGLAAGTIAVSALLTAVALIGYVVTVRTRLTAAEILVAASIAILAFVPVWTYRYLLPLAPFLFLYLVRGIEVAMSRFAGARSSRAARVAPIVLLCVVALDLADHAEYVALAHGPRGVEAIDWLGDAKEIDDLLGWMRHNVAGDGAVASTNPPLVYLATGRHTVAFDDTPERIGELRRMGIRYLVALRPVELPRTQPPSTVLYRTARHGLWIAAAPR